MLAATSIEIATLVVALVAAIGAVASATFAGIFARGAEHRSWQRDLRKSLYSATLSQSDDLIYESMPKFYSYLMADGPPDQATEDALTRKVVDDARALRRNIDDIRTFGSKNVASAVQALSTTTQRLLKLASDDDHTQAQLDLALSEARTALGDFRKAVRRSLRIADD